MKLKDEPPKLDRDAMTIACHIQAIDTDWRGNLLKLVADNLAKQGQHFTASVIFDAANTYGINEP